MLLGITYQICPIFKAHIELLCFSCREKKDAEITGLEDVREKELDELNSLEEGNKRLKESVDKMKSDYALFLQFARENNIQAEMSDIQYQLSPRQRDSD